MPRHQKNDGARNGQKVALSRREASAPAADENNAAPPTLDFLSPEFNRIDELDDTHGNYREFESLAGVVTADMRYHEKRKRRQHRSEAGLAAESPETEAAEKVAAEKQEDATPPPLTIVSRGRLLIIADEPGRALSSAVVLQPRGLAVVLCVVNGERTGAARATLDSYPLIEVDSLVVAGAFGGFSPSFTSEDGRTHSSLALLGEQFDHFDLILDLRDTPSYSGTSLPLGYFAPDREEAALHAALEELPRLRGQFHKPQFTVWRQNRCLHGRSRFQECRKCAAVCPVGAIAEQKDELQIDQYLCQGCGACALVCPADALDLHSPTREELLSDILGQVAAGTAPPRHQREVVFSDREIGGAAGRAAWAPEDRFLVIEVEEIGRIGLEALLLSLVRGAAAVTLLCASSRPREMRQALARQVALGEEILGRLGWPAHSLRFALDMPEVAPPEAVHGSAGPVHGSPGPHGPSGGSGEAAGGLRASPSLPVYPSISLGADGRTLVRQACQQLAQAQKQAVDVVALAPGAPFGAITVAPNCSLCMACAGSCPSGALQTGGDTPRLALVEARCHQCGICAAVCPEEAIERLPRLLYDCEAAMSPVVLREMEPFACVECGRPFATAAMISRMQEKLKAHWMYADDRQARRLQMCRTCRTRDALSTGDYFA